jgi:hypothetical protein
MSKSMEERRLEDIASELADQWAGGEFERRHGAGDVPDLWPGTLEQAREVATAYVLDAFGYEAFEELSHLLLRRARAAWPGFVAQERIRPPLGRRRPPRSRPGEPG